jgi:tRNA(Ile)-lysidine synthase
MKAMVEIRHAIRPWLSDMSAGEKILVGCSGGADSMALAAALAFESERIAIFPVAIVVDHGLQQNSNLVARAVGERLRVIGYQPPAQLRIVAAKVMILDGMEASARRARFEIFERALEVENANYCFLGHTQDDQAETVLLGLARGSGTRSLSGMAAKNGQFIRPLLGITRATTVTACLEAGIEVWDDPHNHDPSYSRVRARRHVLPILEAELGPGISGALARSAKILREDADALDQWATTVLESINPTNIDIQDLALVPKAVRIRVLRSAIYQAGAPVGSLTADHLAPVEALVTDWHGQGPTSLPGGVKVIRLSGRLSVLRQPDAQIGKI